MARKAKKIETVVETPVVETVVETPVVPVSEFVLEQNKRNKQIDAKTFCMKWKEAFDKGETIAWVSDQLGMDLPSCRARASQLRGKGVPLPTLVHAKRGKTPLDLDELSSIFG